MRLVVICKGAFVQSSSWMVTGWELLKQEAAFERDYLLPSPTDGYRGCRRKELKYVIGSAVQFRVLSSLKVDVKQLFEHTVAQHWTPHSGRNYLPSATGALGYAKGDRYLLGRSAQASDRHTRLARQRITTMQLTVAATFSEQVNLDRLAESESLECFRGFLSEVGVPEEAASVSMSLLSARHFVAVARGQNPAPQAMEQLEELEVVVGEPLPQEIPEVKSDKKRRTDNARVQQLGDNPRKVRSEARAALQSGHYASLSGKKNTRILHRLGACFRVLGIDHPRFHYAGTVMPASSDFYKVCSGCVKAGAVDRAEGGSSETQTSSSSDED